MCAFSPSHTSLCAPTPVTDPDSLRQQIDKLEEVNVSLLRHIHKLEKQLGVVQEIATCGLWRWDIPHAHVSWSPATERLFGLLPGSFDNRVDTVLACIVPEDRAALVRQMQGALTQRHPIFRAVYRVQHADAAAANGSVLRWIADHALIDYDARDLPLTMIGFAQDITRWHPQA